ncbi:hypothetical protein PG996_008044 [Apiospora saccharicola]|uniref:Uncharacterized protein n=1 Tax=Apiospora saccharicola TaxID=335842 RepID=A0ABR1UWU1_9PEZI
MTEATSLLSNVTGIPKELTKTMVRPEELSEGWAWVAAPPRTTTPFSSSLAEESNRVSELCPEERPSNFSVRQLEPDCRALRGQRSAMI